ncbi:MAG TPA: PilZ domain-containing protein [Pyrinomonadaceae bacterium]|nr:PilZ domain-containing protein [Pyrinomonadaceae bacterium]
MAIKFESLTARLRRFVGDRRAAPRYPVTHLEKALVVHITLGDGGDAMRGGARLVGYTRDVSETGLGVVLPDVRIGGRLIVNPERALRLLVGLPTGAVEMTATAVRYAEPEGDESGYLVGVHINEMPKAHRALYLKFINSLAVGEM